MSYISDYHCGAMSEEEYKNECARENNREWYENHYPDFIPSEYDTCYDTGDNLGECDCAECPYKDDCTYEERGEEE